MFYANNEQVKGIFLNGRNYNYLAYGFGKIIPEDRNSVQLNLNLAYKYLNHYRIEWGTVKDGYENALVSPRVDEPDYNGIFHTPFTYYYNGSIIPTKQVPVLITDGKYALRNALVYNDMNINGAISYFASNTDFQGHNVKVFPERNNYQILLNDEMLNNCGNFDLNIETRFSKSGYPTLYNCNNFSGNFKYVGSADNKYLGFMGFLVDCKDGVFNIDCTNMHGGGSSANITNYYNFSCISDCNNIKLNINGSPWQAWVHSHCYSYNCNINTYDVISGFSYMNDCNFNMYLPSNANVEKSAYYSILSNSNNCNVHFDGTNSNISSFRNGNSTLFLFQDLNYCNLNLLLNKSTGLDYAFGNRLNNCNIHFMDMNFKQQGFGFMNNCTLTGNFNYADAWAAFVYSSRNVKLNIDARNTSKMILLQNVDSVTGNVNLSNNTDINDCSNSILNLYNGNVSFNVVENCKFRLDSVNVVDINRVYDTNFNLYNAVGTAAFRNLNNVDFVERGGSNYTITNIDNCYNSEIYANTLNGTIENVYNTRIELKNNNPNFTTWGVHKGEITGFPTDAKYTINCTFNASIPVALLRNSRYVTWANVWPHTTPRGSDGYCTKAGLESVDNFSICYLNCNNGSLLAYGGNVTFNNINNMQCDIKEYYPGTVTANLPNYNMNIKLNVDCHNLNLGVFMGGPPHGLEYSSISADNIFCTTGYNYYVFMNYGTRVYCENFCNVPFSPVWRSFSDNYQPVLLINNYQHSNSLACNFNGGIYRIGRLNFQSTIPVNMYLGNGTCMFINNVTLNKAEVNNALLFIGSNVQIIQPNVYNGGLIVSRKNYSMSAISKFVNRNNFTWNFSDSGPWGSQSLLNFCIDV